MKIYLKLWRGLLVPSSDHDEECLKKFKDGEIFYVDLVRPRNGKFHNKYFALLQVGFDQLDYGSQEYKGIRVEKNFETFRKEVAVLCGFYDPVFKFDGTLKLVAKSISFANMNPEEFETLYNNTINVLLNKVMPMGHTNETINDAVTKLLNF